MRLFAAVCFSDRFLDALEDCQRSLRRMGLPGKPSFTKRENLHMTLAFLGEREEADSAVRALERVRFAPFRIGTAGLRAFGDVLTLEIRDGGESVRLAGAVRSALDESRIPYDKKPPLPHITLARKCVGPLPEGVSLLLPDGRVTVASFRLMRSELTRAGAVYTPLHEFRLR